MGIHILAPRQQVNTHDAPDTDASAASLHHTLGLGATEAASGAHAHVISAGQLYYGSGEDGAAVLDGAADVAWAGRVGSVYTMSRDANLIALTVEAGVTLKTYGFRVYCTGTITNHGTIGRAGVGTPPDQRAGYSAVTNSQATLGMDSDGGFGGNGSQNGVAGEAGEGRLVLSYGGVGGVGGADGQGHAGGAAGGLPAVLAINGRVGQAPSIALGIFGTPAVGVVYNRGGSGGGGGAAAAGVFGIASGGGGEGGGTVLLCGRSIVNTGTITARGGDGANATGAVNAGGGGGGGGGVVLISYDDLDDTGTITVAGGLGGNGAGTGSAGLPGNPGTVFSLSLAA